MRKRRVPPGPVPTQREIEVLRAIIQHGTIGAAARSLKLSRHTADSHLDVLRQRSGYHFLPQILAWAISHGWMEMAVSGFAPPEIGELCPVSPGEGAPLGLDQFSTGESLVEKISEEPIGAHELSVP